MTSSIEYLFGSVLMVDGFMLNNQLTDFSLTPIVNGKKVANRLEPLKQPRSSMSPTFVFDNKNNLVMVIGSPGGPRIIQYVVKAIIAHLDWGMNVQEAISLPNHVALNNRIELEDRTNLKEIKPELEKLGHKVVIVDITSGLHGITISNNLLEGGADPRRQGAVAGK
jgi:gamma-glutamyltranspeptidase/glutathione hydrolase